MEEKILGYEQSNLEAWNGIYTAKEIHQQPDVWLKVLHQISTHKEVIQSFLDQVLEHEDLEIILTGAGTSAFAGEVVEPYLHQLTKKSVRA
ncbi:sugar isomerase, partial [Turicibacter sanguinis]|nr:sugar isomerase [Turicibacter sanguinis]